jgi:hypothetical protein
VCVIIFAIGVFGMDCRHGLARVSRCLHDLYDYTSYGGEHTIRRFPTLAIEYNRGTARRGGTSIEELDELLNCLDYNRYVFDERLTKLRLEQWATRSDLESVFNVYRFPRRYSVSTT